MSDGFVHPLSGSEIISDILDQVEKRLQLDCNLRESDAYSGGYEGSIQINLTLHSMDTVKLDIQVPIVNSDVPVDDTVSVEEVVIAETIEIPLETNLDEVRERSGQGVPVQVMDPTTGQTTVKKRKYTRRAIAGAAL